MNSFLVVNLVGGVAVLLSYALMLMWYPEHRESLWGGVGGGLRKLFVLSMLIAAVGYLTFLYLVTSKGVAGVSNGEGLLVTYAPSVLCGIFLTASTTWMPLTVAYLNTESELLWILAVTSLWITVVSLLAMAFVIFRSDAGMDYGNRYIALSGLIYISFHCLVLDAIVWVSKFPRIH